MTSRGQAKLTTGRKRGRPPAEDGAIRERKLLAIARQEFLKRGFDGARLEEIARRTGVSKMTIYRQVGSKAELFHKVTLQSVQSLRTDYQAAIDAGGPPAEVIRKFIRLNKERSNTANFAVLRLVISQAYNTPGFMNLVLQDTLNITQPVADYLLAIGYAANPAQAMRGALLLQSMAVGGILKLLGCEEPDSDAWQDDVLDLFMNGIALRLTDGSGAAMPASPTGGPTAQ